MSKIGQYYRLTKPGIIYGNITVLAAGVLLAANGTINVLQLVMVVLATALIIGSACVINNYMDRGIDRKMERTKTRALVTGEISGKAALTFAGFLALIGFPLLFFFSNWLTVGLGVAAYITYLIPYALAKRHSVHSTLVGGIAGALPPVAGYTAVVGVLDYAALLLFLIMMFWQMPHFYAIGLFRKKEYAAAHLPIATVKQAKGDVVWQMVVYVILFAVAALLLPLVSAAGYVYTLIMAILSGVWLGRAIAGFRANDIEKWARNMFIFSIRVLMVFSLLLAGEWLLP